MKKFSWRDSMNSLSPTNPKQSIEKKQISIARQLLSTVLIFVLSFGLCLPATTAPATAAPAREVSMTEASSQIQKIPAEESQIHSHLNWSGGLQIPNETRGGIYFVTRYGVSFYDPDSNTLNQEMETTNLDSTFVLDNKLYFLCDQEPHWTLRKYIILDLNTGKVLHEQRDLPFENSVIGADDQGRVLLLNKSTDTLTILDDKGNELSQISCSLDILNMIHFDSKTNTLYYNEIIDGYNPDNIPHQNRSVLSLQTAKISGNTMTATSQEVQYPLYSRSDADHYQPAEVLQGKYFSTDSDYRMEWALWDIDSYPNKKILSVPRSRELQNSELEHYDFFHGSGAAYDPNLDAYMVLTAQNTITMVDASTGKSLYQFSTTYPIFSLMYLNQKLMVIESANESYYCEAFQLTPSTELHITNAKDLTVGDILKLEIKTNGNMSEILTWTSSNDAVAKVNEYGEVYALKPGTATITVTSATGLKDSCTISIQDKEMISSSNAIPLETIPKENRNANNYNGAYGLIDQYEYPLATRVYSYLFENEDGSLGILDYDDMEEDSHTLLYYNYSYDGKLLEKKTISTELTYFGGFYNGSKYHYLVFGEDNKAETDKQEVIRVVKYSKDWKRLDSVSIYGANTKYPFDAGSLRMTECNGSLFIHTCHTIYIRDDGLNHQTNMSMELDAETLDVKNSWHEVEHTGLYVSHSFNQFVTSDDRYVYWMDHGDAYPRGISFSVMDTQNPDQLPKQTTLMTFVGDTGDNYTGASLGGLEIGTDHCVLVGNTIGEVENPQYLQDTRNVFFCSVDKKTLTPKFTWLTNYDRDENVQVGNPVLVKYAKDSFLVMWNEYDKDVTHMTKMVLVDSKGNLMSDVFTTPILLSDCKPIVDKNGYISWYVTWAGQTLLYRIDPYHLEETAYPDIIPLKAPALYTPTATTNGGLISWQPVEFAESYRVKRKTDGGSWKVIGTTTDTSYLDNTGESGIWYYYTAEAICGDNVSEYNPDGVELYYQDVPKLKSLSNTKKGLKITWNTIDGCYCYVVYRKTQDSDWQSIVWQYTRDEDKTSSFVDEEVTHGTAYTYTVAPVKGYYEEGPKDPKGLTLRRVKMPSVKKVSVTTTGVKVTWNAVDSVDSYYIYRKTEKSSWKKIGSSSSTSYTDKTAESGTTYSYSVRAKIGGSSSAYDTKGKSTLFLATPKLKKASSTSKGVKITWSTVKGAEKYRVYRKTSSSDWERIGETTKGSFTDKTAKKKKTYYYTVRAMKGSKLSSYDSSGLKIKFKP